MLQAEVYYGVNMANNLEINFQQLQNDVRNLKKSQRALTHWGFFTKIIAMTGPKLFETLFAFSIGFEWVFLITDYHEVKSKVFFIRLPALPDIKYFKNFDKQDEATSHEEYAISKALLYTFTWKDSWAVLLNYLARNLGRVVGFLVSFSVLVPFLVLYKIFELPYQLIKILCLTIKTQWSFRAFQAEELLQQWIREVPDNQTRLFSSPDDFSFSSNPSRGSYTGKNKKSFKVPISEAQIARYISPENLFTALVNNHLSQLTSDMPFTPARRINYSKYQKARLIEHSKEYVSSLITICATAIFVIPLFYTIPKLIGLLRHHEEETIKMKKDYSMLTSLWQIQRSIAEDKCFEIGKMFLGIAETNLALQYLSAVSRNSPFYLEAMEECGHMLVADEQPDLAKDFFEKAHFLRGAQISQVLIANPQVKAGYPALPTTLNSSLTTKGALFSPRNSSDKGKEELDENLPLLSGLGASAE
jgi:hypothetical protein